VLSFCSIATREALPHARVLSRALHQQYDDARLTVLLLDGTEILPDADFDAVRPEALGAWHEGLELGEEALADQAAVLKPALMSAMLEGGAEIVVFLEADIDVLAGLDPAIAQAGDADVLLVPRVTEGIPDDGLQPSDRELAGRGLISGALVVTRRGSTAQEFLRWWGDRLIDAARTNEETARQPSNLTLCSPSLDRCLGVAPTVFGDRVAMLTDPGICLSHWNVHARPLDSRDGAVTAAGEPVRCIQFSGFRPDRPYWLSEYATRPRVLDDPVLGELCASYARRLIEAGWVDPSRAAGEGRLASGVPFDDRLRRLHATAVGSGVSFGDVHTERGTEAFASWLSAPAEQGGHAGVNRYLYDVYVERADLRKAYPDLHGQDAHRLVRWAWDHGRQELELKAEFLPKVAAASDRSEGGRQIAVNVAGYLDKSLGLGQAARLYIMALQAADVPVGTITAPLHLPVAGSQEQALARYGHQQFDHLELPYQPSFNLLCVNPDGLPDLLERGGAALHGATWSIGQWGWETDLLPPHWLKAFELVDEVWVYSRYVADNLSRFSPVPIMTIPLPVIAPESGNETVDFEFGDEFVFLFVFDFFSTLRRKNPQGLIDAFTKAFAPGEGPKLVLKAMNGSFRPQALDELRWRVGDRPDIQLIDQHVDKDAYASLLARCDCYVSLHRAEGFGLTLAEAMALGKPVIATGYSGNLDFMTPANSFLVDYTLTRVGPDAELYPAEGTWAEPDVEHAAALMRQVWTESEEARGRGARAARDVRERFAPSVVGALARSRLEQLAQQRPSPRAAVTSSSSFDELDRRLATDPANAPGRRGGLGAFMRRVILRFIRPFTHHERELDAEIVQQLKRIAAELARERASAARDRARLQQLEARLGELAREQAANGGDAGRPAPERLSSRA
jgi:glycosyltransferase involved in cell wall biosynthesis